MTGVTDTVTLLSHRYYSPAKLAAELEIERPVIYKAISSQALRAFRPGKQWRINRQDALIWLASVSNTEGTGSKRSKAKQRQLDKIQRADERAIALAFRSRQK